MADYQNHAGNLYTGVATGSSATWTDSYGQGNSFTEVATTDTTRWRARAVAKFCPKPTTG